MEKKLIAKITKKERELILIALSLRDEQIKNELIDVYHLFDAMPKENLTYFEKEYYRGKMDMSLEICDNFLNSVPDFDQYPNYYQDFIDDVIKGYNAPENTEF
jgi:hypothetical protein